jgi:hypothetical protein
MMHVGGAYAFPLTWILLVISAIWLLAELLGRNNSLHAWLPAGVTFIALLATYFCIPPNCGVPKYNLSQRLLEPAPLHPERLYLSIYPPPELNYRIEAKPQPIGQVVRPGSTSMWAGVHLINGYSPIRPAGVARQFNFAIHGEIDPGTADWLLQDPVGTLDVLGVDGIIVAQESWTNPPPAKWQLVFSNEEGRVFHRPGAPFPRVRSVSRIGSLPGQEFVSADISHIDDSRNRLEADVDVPLGDKPALLEFSRPYFRGYIAKIGDRELTVGSYRGLIPIVKMPPGAHGRLTLLYRPCWLIFGCAVAAASSTVWLLGLVAGLRHLISAPR